MNTAIVGVLWHKCRVRTEDQIFDLEMGWTVEGTWGGVWQIFDAHQLVCVQLLARVLCFVVMPATIPRKATGR